MSGRWGPGGAGRLRLAALAWAMACAGGAFAQVAGQEGERAPADAATLRAGEALYLEGRRSDGEALQARRAGGLSLRGAEAACVNCHRRSGFGGSEGRSYIPPINAASLFNARAPGGAASAAGIGRPAYTGKTLVRALRDGIDPAGRRLDYLMPRYQLGDAEAAALTAYLAQLSTQPPPAGDWLDFATVVAPGMAATRAEAMVGVLAACFAEHNAGPPPVRGRKRLGPEMSVGRQSPWRLHVWNLSGPPASWAAQLAVHAQRQPVFALVGGLGGGDWAPVHEFCENSRTPCLFPHLEAPGGERPGFYSLYLSRGVELEAALVAQDLLGRETPVPRVVQVRRAGDEAARAGAAALRRQLVASGIAMDEQVIDGAVAAGPFAATAAWVLWLRDDDLRRLADAAPAGGPVYLSATLADPENAALPAAWRDSALVAYPYELPEKRDRHRLRLQAWLAKHGLPPVAGPVQADAHLACAALAAGMNETAGRLHRDYLVERLEVVMERISDSGLYPRLALGAGQRFASKSGYLVRFAEPAVGGIVPVGERIAP